MDRIPLSGVNSAGVQAPVKQMMQSERAAVTLDAKAGNVQVLTAANSGIGIINFVPASGSNTTILGYRVTQATSGQLSDANAKTRLQDCGQGVSFGRVGETMIIESAEPMDDLFIVGITVAVNSNSNCMAYSQVLNVDSFWTKLKAAGAKRIEYQCSDVISIAGLPTAQLIVSAYT